MNVSSPRLMHTSRPIRRRANPRPTIGASPAPEMSRWSGRTAEPACSPDERSEIRATCCDPPPELIRSTGSEPYRPLADFGCELYRRHRAGNGCQLLRLIVRERLQGLQIGERHLAILVGNELVRPQLLHHAIEMGNAEAQHVRHDFLRKGQAETVFPGAAD